jgi:adenosylcobinamide-GDP ribazoletransferase
MLLNSLRALLQFTTVLPLGSTADFSLFSKRSYLYPLAGYVTGGLAGLAAFWISEPGIRAAVAIAALMIITGANHFDGLLDFGDGLMAHGGRERRVMALTDRQIGTGGFVAGSSIILLSFAALSSSTYFLPALIVAEVFGKFSMAFLTAYGSPFREGLHASLHREAKPWFPILSALLCVPLVFLSIPIIPLCGAASVALLVPAILLTGSYRLFGGINGDVVGAAGEITRSIVLCALVLVPASTLF